MSDVLTKPYMCAYRRDRALELYNKSMPSLNTKEFSEWMRVVSKIHVADPNAFLFVRFCNISKDQVRLLKGGLGIKDLKNGMITGKSEAIMWGNLPNGALDAGVFIECDFNVLDDSNSNKIRGILQRAANNLRLPLLLDWEYRNKQIRYEIITDVVSSSKVTPAMAIEARDQHIDLLTHKLEEIKDLSVIEEFPERVASLVFDKMKDCISQADLVIWRKEMWDASQSGLDIFTDYVPTLEFLNTIHPQLWFLEDSGQDYTINTGLDFGLKEDMFVSFLLIAPARISNTPETDEEFIFHGESATGSKGMICGICFTKADVKPGDPYPLPEWRFVSVPVDGEKIPWDSRPFIAAIEFMKLEIISKERIQPPRHIRRQAERAKKKLPSVHTIYLRRTKAAKPNPKDTPEDIDRKRREYSVQFLVGGHWRNQWYDSLQTHKRIYIAPYMKGDASLPLKTESVGRAYLVRR